MTDKEAKNNVERLEARVAELEKHLREHDCDFMHTDPKSECWCQKGGGPTDVGPQAACVHVPNCECHEPGDVCYEVVADNPPERGED